jgi:uncharacterized protein YbjQ (UPF0145 family)
VIEKANKIHSILGGNLELYKEYVEFNRAKSLNDLIDEILGNEKALKLFEKKN